MEIIPITTEFIRLDAALKLSGLVDTGGQAKMLIQEGHVLVGGEPCPLRGKKLYPGTPFPWGIGSFKWPGRRADTLWW